MKSPGAYVGWMIDELKQPFFFDSVFFRNSLPCSGGLSPGDGWDAVP